MSRLRCKTACDETEEGTRKVHREEAVWIEWKLMRREEEREGQE